MGNINKLLDGFKRFQLGLFGENSQLADQLKKGQHPEALIIGCCDSRVDPALLTDCAPGDLFTLRNIANLVPPYEKDEGYHGVSAALEFAVRSLEVADIIILGHSGCGGIAGLLEAADGNEVGEFVGKWVSIAAAARDNVMKNHPGLSPKRLARACEQEAILASLQNLHTFPWIRERVESGQLALHGWYFDLSTGQLFQYNPELGKFQILIDCLEPDN